MEKQIIISVMSQDRPGIIADITGAIYTLNGDLADLNQSVLFGYLTMILIATFDDHVTPQDILREIARIQSPTKLDVIVRSMDTTLDTSMSGLPEKTYVVTAQGENRSGLVHGISSFCYRHNINILDLATTRTGDRYTMILQLDLSRVGSINEIRKKLQEYGEQSGLHVVMQHHQLFKVTNEINF
ncbi:MAG: ACT domain-containing protein [Desulfocapsaceae bacterium]|jgi:glycine cleavage system transcriptional repressor|nr:ACT domain-containing protein [Desulfocapsaceae bacterium]